MNPATRFALDLQPPRYPVVFSTQRTDSGETVSYCCSTLENAAGWRRHAVERACAWQRVE